MKNLNHVVIKTFLIVLVTAVFLIEPISVTAQGGGGPIPPHVLPLTGGIGLLLALGIGAGIFYKNKSGEKH